MERNRVIDKDLHYYEPANGHGLRHDPFNAIIAPRPIGGAKGVVVPPAFFEPMPNDFLDAFESGPVFPQTSRASRVAERPATYGRGRSKRRP